MRETKRKQREREQRDRKVVTCSAGVISATATLGLLFDLAAEAFACEMGCGGEGGRVGTTTRQHKKDCWQRRLKMLADARKEKEGEQSTIPPPPKECLKLDQEEQRL